MNRLCQHFLRAADASEGPAGAGAGGSSTGSSKSQCPEYRVEMTMVSTTNAWPDHVPLTGELPAETIESLDDPEDQPLGHRDRAILTILCPPGLRNVQGVSTDTIECWVDIVELMSTPGRFRDEARKVVGLHRALPTLRRPTEMGGEQTFAQDSLKTVFGRLIGRGTYLRVLCSQR